MSQLHRKIRSFVRREGRLTNAQAAALADYGSLYGINIDQGVLDFDNLFGNQNPVTLEIGFGNGESLVTMAAAAPERNFIGVEVHRPGVGNLLLKAHQLKLKNLRVLVDDAVEILEQLLPDDSLDGVQIFFPDPWHKKRHHKRRLIQPAFIDLLARKQRRQGSLHLATDWQEYAEHMLSVMESHSAYRLITPAEEFHQRPSFRPETKFERRGINLGHSIWDIIYTRE